MRLFCDHCGTEFGIEILRTDSMFCTICGKSLSDYVKKHATSVLKKTPKIGPSEGRRVPSRLAKRPAVARPTEKPSKKRRNADAEIGVQEEEEQESDNEGRRNTRSRRRPLPVSAEVETNPDDLETSTTEGNQDTEETEGLGKGKRIRKSTQRYTDDPSQPQRLSKKIPLTIPPNIEPNVPPEIPQHKNNCSLSQILNSAPTIAQLPLVIRAAFVSPISLSGFRLPPPIPIPDAVADRGRILKRESIAHILGGSQKTTFPYPRNRNQGPTYACLKESENDLLPRNPGEHGIIIVKSLPEALEKNGFTVLVKAKRSIYWTYCGIYKVIHIFQMSREQWKGLGEKTKFRKIRGTLRSKWGKEWCVDSGVLPTEEAMMKAFDDGIMSWQATVVQCINYDSKLVHQLVRA